MCIFNKDKDELPENGERVLIKVLREGVVLTTFGYHIGEQGANYDEEDEYFHDFPGWYEASIYGEFEYSIEDEVVGWSPVPKIARELM